MRLKDRGFATTVVAVGCVAIGILSVASYPASARRSVKAKPSLKPVSIGYSQPRLPVRLSPKSISPKRIYIENQARHRGVNRKASRNSKSSKKPKKPTLPYVDRRREQDDRERHISERIRDAFTRWRLEARRSRGVSTAGSAVLSFNRLRPFAKFHTALARFTKNRTGSRLNILQLGDSHTAGDHFSGFLREVLQKRYGDGGRGMLAPGAPYAYYRPYQIRVIQSKGWRIYRSRRDGRYEPIGLAGYMLRSDDPDDTILMELKGTKTFRQIVIEYVGKKTGGGLFVKVDGRKIRTIQTRQRRWQPKRVTINLKRSARRVELSPDGEGVVDLLSVSIFRAKTGGLVYSSHGINGERISVMDFWNRGLVKWQLDWLRPALIVLAYGTNEGFDHKLRLGEYRRSFRRNLSFLRRAAPYASIVVVGAPNVSRLPSWCARRPAKREKFSCKKLKSSHADRYTSMIAKKSDDLCYWHEPPTVEKVRDIQRRVSRLLGVYYWDWSKVMSGTCGTDRWSREDPPLAFRDRVHMKPAGYDLSAVAFMNAILGGYRGR